MLESPSKLFALALCLVGCRPNAAEPEPIVVASDDRETPTPTVDETPAQPFEIVYYVDRELWRIDPDGTNARSLGYEPPTDGVEVQSRVGGGTHEPAVSRDGKWLACLTGPNLLVVNLAGEQAPKVHAITALPPAKDNWIVAADVSYSAWSPDSTALVVFLEQPGYEEQEPLPLPSGYKYGAHILRTSDLKLEHAPHIDSYLGWTPDSKAVVDSKYNAASDYDLLAYPLAPGQATILHHSNGAYGHSQVNIMGDRIAWTESGDGSISQIVVMTLFGGDIVPLSPQGKFADIQWPRLSPSGKQVVFKQKGKFMLGEGPTQTVEWRGPPEFQWWDDEHVLAVTGAGLVMMDLQGNTRVLTEAATRLAHH